MRIRRIGANTNLKSKTKLLPSQVDLIKKCVEVTGIPLQIVTACISNSLAFMSFTVHERKQIDEVYAFLRKEWRRKKIYASAMRNGARIIGANQ